MATCLAVLLLFCHETFCYYTVGCKKDAHATRLHHAVAYTLTRLFRSLGLAVQLESLYLFVGEYTDNRRPDIKTQNPFG